MSREEDVHAAIETLRGSARELGGEAELLANELASLTRRPPSLSYKDFDNAGAEEELSDARDSTDRGVLLERIVDESNLLPVSFLEQGASLQRSVARVVLTQPHMGFPPGTGWATGSLVSPSLFLTNNHVIENRAFAGKIRMQFNYQLGPDGMDRSTESYFPDTQGTFHTNPGLDYTLIRLRPQQVVDDPTFGTRLLEPGERWGRIPLNPSPIYRQNQRFNVVQHPSGRRKEVALQSNTISRLLHNAVRYTADTEPGSSGSPVFDNLWQLVALHHAGGDRDANGQWINNEGIRMDRLVEDLREAFANDSQTLAELGI